MNYQHISLLTQYFGFLDYNYIKRIFNESESKLKGKLYIEAKLKDKELDDNIIKAFFEHYNEEPLANKLSNKDNINFFCF